MKISANFTRLATAITASLLALSIGQFAAAGEALGFRDDTPQPSRRGRQVDSSQLERLRAIMAPLLRAMDNPVDPRNVRVSISDVEQINAGNAGNGQFVVTRGLLERANDEELRGVLAHEIAHEDLGHVAKQQLLGTGLNIGVALLERYFPASGAIAPLAGSLVANSYSRSEELAADRHGVELLQRAGYSKEVMINALAWIASTPGGQAGGGFLSTHPATEERIQALKRMA